MISGRWCTLDLNRNMCVMVWNLELGLNSECTAKAREERVRYILHTNADGHIHTHTYTLSIYILHTRTHTHTHRHTHMQTCRQTVTHTYTFSLSFLHTHTLMQTDAYTHTYIVHAVTYT